MNTAVDHTVSIFLGNGQKLVASHHRMQEDRWGAYNMVTHIFFSTNQPRRSIALEESLTQQGRLGFRGISK
jgi:hypothetical protein